MVRHGLVKGVLLCSGIIGILVGLGALFAPIAFHATSGIALGNDINLLSEMRAAGGVLLVCGVLITYGAFVSHLSYSAVLISTVVYLSYGLSRLIAMGIDGIPSESLITITVFEIAMGLVNGYVLVQLSTAKVIAERV